ncbi:MAG: ABC transporter ATP-binding protein [Candidatus Heimdallarchaeota archaeon]|nr:ABC transporter ATP-binding protein [Candidatus Heimdallarchaeota archaeon]MCK5049893.1 ABC transporter ATP-binding protein [Candidatus Heimdallarchaeota archaeon]
MTKTKVVEIKDLERTYVLPSEEIKALKGVSFDVVEGEFHCIMGVSGSGKSTLLNIIGTIDKPTKGDVKIAGRTIIEEEEEALAHLRNDFMGFIYQDYHLIPSLTAQKNIEVPLIFANIPREERKRRSKEELKRVGLEERGDHRPTQLSGGQQQRVAIARALVNKPKLLLADEPTANLDIKTGKLILELLKSINQEEGITVINSSHDLRVIDLSDRITYLRGGRIVESMEIMSIKITKKDL